MIDLKTIPLFKDCISIEDINVESRCKNKYKVKTRENTYFVKIEDAHYAEKDINNAKWIYQRCLEEGVSVLPLVDVLSFGDETLWIYPFFEGETILDKDYSLDKFREYGEKVAEDILKLNKIEPISSFSTVDLNKQCEERINKIKIRLNDEESSKYMLKIFDKDEWNELARYYKELCEKTINDRVCLNHNDIKLPNILIDKDDNYYLIDFGPLILTNVGYNIGYSISCFLFKSDKENEKSCLRGFIKTIDKTHELLDQLNYYLISDFINKLDMYKDDYLNNINYIRAILFNRDNILSNEIYEK